MDQKKRNGESSLYMRIQNDTSSPNTYIATG